jgi:hypothetical protein
MAAHAPVRIRRGLAPRVPRRVSGPVYAPPRPVRPSRPPMAGQATTTPVRRVIAVSQGRLIDRLVRGRLWIPVLGVLLMGIVFMQVSMLSMNAGIGRSVKQSSQLERDNAALRAELSRLVIGNSVSDAAAAAGMVVPEPGDYHVLTAGDGDAARRAASSLTAPIAPVQASAPAATTATTAPTTSTTPAPVTPAATPAQTAPASTGTGAAATPAATPQVGATSGGGTAAPGV